MLLVMEGPKGTARERERERTRVKECLALGRGINKIQFGSTHRSFHRSAAKPTDGARPDHRAHERDRTAMRSRCMSSTWSENVATGRSGETEDNSGLRRRARATLHRSYPSIACSLLIRQKVSRRIGNTRDRLCLTVLDGRAAETRAEKSRGQVRASERRWRWRSAGAVFPTTTAWN